MCVHVAVSPLNEKKEKSCILWTQTYLWAKQNVFIIIFVSLNWSWTTDYTCMEDFCAFIICKNKASSTLIFMAQNCCDIQKLRFFKPSTSWWMWRSAFGGSLTVSSLCMHCMFLTSLDAATGHNLDYLLCFCCSCSSGRFQNVSWKDFLKSCLYICVMHLTVFPLRYFGSPFTFATVLSVNC